MLSGSLKGNTLLRKPLKQLTPKQQKIMGWASIAVWLILTLNVWDKPYSTAFKTWVTLGNTGVFCTIAFYAFAHLRLSEKHRRGCFAVMIVFAILGNGLYMFMPRNEFYFL